MDKQYLVKYRNSTSVHIFRLLLLCAAGSVACASIEHTDDTASGIVMCQGEASLVKSSGLAGPEDVTFDSDTGIAFISAYDRWLHKSS